MYPHPIPHTLRKYTHMQTYISSIQKIDKPAATGEAHKTASREPRQNALGCSSHPVFIVFFFSFCLVFLSLLFLIKISFCHLWVQDGTSPSHAFELLTGK